MGAWTDKPCAECAGKKSAKCRDKKYCFRCGIAARKVAANRRHRSYVAKTYGIAPDDYGKILAVQNGRCAICQRATGRTRRLAVDHDHATGQVRGCLCGPCNDMLGHARDSEEFFARALMYLRCPPAASVLTRD